MSGLASLPSINRAKFLDGDHFYYLLKKSLLKSPSLLCLVGLSLLLSLSSVGGRRERTMEEELVVGLSHAGVGLVYCISYHDKLVTLH